MQNKVQESMGFKLPEKGNNSWYVPLNRNNLISALAGGVISPYKSFVDYEDDLQRFAGDGVLLIKKGISREVNDSEELSGSSGYTVLAEIDINVFPKKQISGIDEHGKGCKTKISKDKAITRMLSFPGVIPVTKITAIHFKSDLDKKSFIVRGFDNVPTNIVPLEVSEQLFDQEMSTGVIEGLKNFSVGGDGVLKSLYEQSDSYAGSAVLLVATIPPDESWMSLMKKVVESRKLDNVPDMNSVGIIKDKLELNLFNAAFTMLSKMDREDGWQAKKVLSDLYTAVDKAVLSKEESSQLDKWLKTCEEILDNKRNVTPLTDSKMKVGRAILLLLLRPDPEDVINSVHSSLEPGVEVLSLAAILSGARYGFEGLPNNIKSTMPGYELFVNLKADLINCGWKNSILQKYSFLPELDIKIKEWGIMGVSYTAFVDKKELVEKKNEGSVELRLVLTKAEAAGVKLKYERKQHRLSYRYEFKSGRTQTVYVKVGEPNGRSDKTIRFWSPCLDLSTVKSRKVLNKIMCEKLLEKNCDPSLYCRFALCKPEKEIVVIYDQILMTMDEKELSLGMEHVALSADKFERELGVDVY